MNKLITIYLAIFLTNGFVCANIDEKETYDALASAFEEGVLPPWGLVRDSLWMCSVYEKIDNDAEHAGYFSLQTTCLDSGMCAVSIYGNRLFNDKSSTHQHNLSIDNQALVSHYEMVTISLKVIKYDINASMVMKISGNLGGFINPFVLTTQLKPKAMAYCKSYNKMPKL